MSDLKIMMASAIDPDKCEGTAYPYWLIIDPARVRLAPYITRAHYISSAITGPFFSREAADEHLRVAAHHYSQHTIVFCASGHNSEDWVKLIKIAKKESDDAATA